MAWILKARYQENNYFSDKDGEIRFTQEGASAKQFNTSQEAEEFASKLESGLSVEAWNLRGPQLFPIRIDSRSFIVDFWEFVFKILGGISIFSLTRWLSKIFKKEKLTRSYVFVEIWVLLCSVLSVSFLFIATSDLNKSYLGYFLLAFGALRVFETVIYHVNVILFDEYRTKKNKDKPPYAVRGFRRLVILTVHNYFEILIWFAGFYSYAHCSFEKGQVLLSLSGALYHSIVTMSTLGYGDIYPLAGKTLGIFLSCTQTLIGIFLAIVVFARIIAMIPRPFTMDEYES